LIDLPFLKPTILTLKYLRKFASLIFENTKILMSTRLRIFLVSLIIFLQSASKANAYEIIFTQFSTSNGLSSNFVNCVGQSANGYIWVGTQNGLQRYDGYRFTPTIRKSLKNRIPPLPVNQILRSTNIQQLWIRMGQTIGLFNIGDYSFTKVEIENIEDVVEKFDFKLYTDQVGNTYLLINKYGILVYNKNKNRFERNKAVIDYPANWEPTVMVADRDGLLWVGGIMGLGCYDRRTKTFYTNNNNPKKLPILQMAKAVNGVVNMAIDSKKRFFINSWPGGAYYQTLLLDPKVGKPNPVTYEQEEGSNYYELNHISENNGIIWSYGNHVFNIFDEEKHRFTRFYDPKSITYGIRVNQVYQLFLDRDKNIWVASDNGLYIISILKNDIRNGSTPYFKGADVLFVKKMSNHRFLMGSWGERIKVLSYDKNLIIRPDDELLKAVYKNEPTDENYRLVWSAEEIPEKNEIWFGCQTGRIIRYNTQKKQSEFFLHPIFRESTIRSIVKDSDNNLWFGLQNGLLIKYSKDKKYSVAANFDHVVVSKILIDKYQNLWIATLGKGLFYFDPKKEKIIRNYKAALNGNELSTSHIKDFTPLNDSIMAIACSANLDLLNIKTHKIKQLTAYDGLPQQTITSLQVDAQGFLWMSTIGGICRFDPITKLFRMYDQKDGLRSTSNLSNLMENSASLEDGYLIFTGPKNFMIFKPTHLNTYTRPKNPLITEFKLFNTFLSVDSIKRLGGINLAHNKNSISISFASLNYLQSNKVKYFYKLFGANDNWAKAENGVSAAYASLAPGGYTFMVRAQNSDGIFSPITMLEINISPAFWQTWWFILVVIAIAFLPVYFIYKLRLRRLIEVQKIREKVARDLHDDMGSTLTSINILSEMAKGKVINEPETVKDYLRRISKNSSQMMEAMDDIVWSINPMNDSMLRITARMREFATGVLEARDIDFTFRVDEVVQDLKLDMEARRDLFLLFKEAVNNLAKYAQCKNAVIDLSIQKDKLLMLIKDDGVGFDVLHADEGNGLLNMKKRAQSLNGTLLIESKPGAGTKVLLEVDLT
jgi:ligand-binding sensor domain-containing protein/two-component sensor histidine kinase